MTPSRSSTTSFGRRVIVTCAVPGRASAADPLAQIRRQLADGHPLLRARVALANRDGIARQRVAVDRDAVRRAGLVLAAVAAADRTLLIVEDRVLGLQPAKHRE